MYQFLFKALALALIALDAFSAVRASLYVIQPSAGSTCSGGSPCTVQWLDDGTSPVNSEIGVAACGLYTGNMQLVQTIDPVDVSSSQSLEFTPISNAGPDSSDYYIAFISTSLEINGTNYTSYSPFFSLNNMNGSFSSALASATSSIPIPSSLTGSIASTETGILSTITVGTVTTLSSISTLSTTLSSSRFSTSTLASSSTSATISSSSASVISASNSLSTSSATGTTSTNDAESLRTASLPLFGLLSFIVLLFL